MRKMTLGSVAFLAVLAFTSAAWADATVYIVHGIPGSDLGLDPDLPVDISVNGNCAIQDFRFGEILGPLELPAGFYDIDISLADPNNPCGNPPVISVAGLELEDDVNYSIVANLDPSVQPVASVFVNNLEPTGRGKCRLPVHHTANAPTVDVKVARNENGTGPKLMIPDFEYGNQAEAEVRPGEWWVSIAPAGSGMPVFGPVMVELEPFTGYLVYAVGSVNTNTFTLLIKPVMGLKPMPKNQMLAAD